jgi:hypothetical protein
MLWTLVPSKRKVGKMDKVPVSPVTLSVHSAHDPAHWVDAATACALATQCGPTYGVAFVFTPTDPFFFVDLDNHRTETGDWTDHAKYVASLFPGAAMEVSQSGNGLHIFGRTAPITHGCKNEANRMELYTQYRFAALTGINATGNVDTDHSFNLAQFAGYYFPYIEGQDVNGDFTLSTGPVAEWRGPVDDADLIRRALMSKSAAAVFGQRASFKDLWEANAEVLAVVYPDPDRRWNESSADAALAAHLGFWTGKHGERMARLMWQSGLKREKWDRPDYIPRTITEILAKGGAVCQDEPPAPGPVDTLVVPPDSPTMSPVVGSTFLDGPATASMFNGCVYVKDRNRVLVPGSGLVKPDQFNVLFGGFTFAMDDINQRTTRKAYEAFTENQLLRPPLADRTCFRPDLPALSIVEDAGKRRVNVYEPANVRRVKGDASPMWAHLAKLLPDETDRVIFWSYMCAVVQFKGQKFQWAPVLQGVEGNGKTLLSACVAYAVGSHFTFWPDAQELDNKFNAWLAGRIFIAVEELRHPDHLRREIITEKLKIMITGGQGMQIEAKGVDQDSTEICCNFMMTTNHLDSVRKTPDMARRMGMFYSPQRHHADLAVWGMTGDYFPKLVHWLKHQDGFAIVAEELATFVIPDEYNPLHMSRAPHTSTTNEAYAQSRGAVEQQIIEAVEQGQPGFAGGWISTVALNGLLEEMRQGQRINLIKRREMLHALGYELHRGLPDGRVNNPVMPDGRKTQLFIRTGHPDAALTVGADVARAYTLAQTVK